MAGLGSEKWTNQLIWLLPVTLLSCLWLIDPTASTLASKTVSLGALNASQKINIQLASRAADGTVLKPGEEFSFNRKVGPRTEARGYEAARSYLGCENPVTIGGGICLLSSALYQAALESGLTIMERVPHLRTIQTVPAGLDATVWYGQADLKFRNDSAYPIVLNCKTSARELKVQVLSERAFDKRSVCAIHRRLTRANREQVQVEVFRRCGCSDVLISRDLYRLSP